jgi:hypothetical protein
LDLHDVKDLYEQASAYNVTSGLPPSDLVSQLRVDHETSPTDDETKQIIIFVHGINNTQFAYYDSTEILYKRLYWSGYHGKVSGFRWPCAYLPFDNTLNPFKFNVGEFYAWKSASALRDYLNYFRNRPDMTNYTINLIAHSQGNVVTSEAIKQGGAFDNYILTQGAIPAMCYDTSTPIFQKLVDAETNKATPFFSLDGGYFGYHSSLSGNLINFYNTNDYALQSGTWHGFQANWVEDQRAHKPETLYYPLTQQYFFSPSTLITYRFYSDGHSEVVTDLQEILGLAARSRTKAVGAQENVGGVINASASVDLLATFHFGNTRAEHSAEFTRPIQTVLGYYQTILNRIQPAQ